MQKIAAAAVDAYDAALLERLAHYANSTTSDQRRHYASLSELPPTVYRDSDIPDTLDALHFEPYFKQAVAIDYSTVKVSDEVPRNSHEIVDATLWTAKLDSVFKSNYRRLDKIRWQHFGSAVGMMRVFPGREWDSNFAGFYNDYDARVRPWYIAATSGPKDVVILIDCSLSMAGRPFVIAKAVAKNVILTLTKQDYVNVICAHESYWDEKGK